MKLGDKLFHDKRFSSTGNVACANCHEVSKAFTDGPLSVSVGIKGLTGTRNAPTVLNAAFFETMFWDGRSPSLEDQALHPFLNPVEMGLKASDLTRIVHPHPTLSETLMECAEMFYGHATHAFSRKRA